VDKYPLFSIALKTLKEKKEKEKKIKTLLNSIESRAERVQPLLALSEQRAWCTEDILQFLFILAEQGACCPIWVHASYHRHIFFDSVQPLLGLSEQRAWCTFFSLFRSASLLSVFLGFPI